jgi:hypothetical protein
MKGLTTCGLVLALAAAALVTGCGEQKPKPGPGGGGGGGGGTAPPDNTQEVLPDPATVGSITVTVKLKGTPPERKEVPMTEAECAAAHADKPHLDETVVPGSNGTLQNCMVWVGKGIDAKYAWKAPSTPVQIDQRGCVYYPHVVTMHAKQAMEVKNSDGVNHNIHSLPEKNSPFNFAQGGGKSNLLTTESKDKTFLLAEVPIKIKCDIHGWMGAWVGAFKHPYHGVTGADGTVKLDKVPPGTLSVMVWHEKYANPAKEVEVKLEAKGAQSVTVELGE